MRNLFSLLLIECKHVHAFSLTQLAHIADISKRKVVVEAPLTGPVSYTFSWSLWCFSFCVESNRAVFNIVLLGDSIHDLLLHDFRLFLVYLLFWLKHMLWFSVNVLGALSFFASITLLSSLKVVILTFVTLPATIRELETTLFHVLTKTFVLVIILIILLKVLRGLPVVEVCVRIVFRRWLVIVNNDVIDRLWNKSLLLLWRLEYILLNRVERLRIKDSGCCKKRTWATAWRRIFMTWVCISRVSILTVVYVQILHILYHLVYRAFLLIV